MFRVTPPFPACASIVLCIAVLLVAGCSGSTRGEFDGTNAAGLVPRFQEIGGMVVIEAENYTSKTGDWKTVQGASGQAMMIPTGNWTDHLVYEINFDQAGTYNVWLYGRSGGDGGSNDVKVFFNPEEITSEGDFYEVALPNEWGWEHEMRYKTPENRKTPGMATIRVDSPGWQKLHIVKGAEPENAELPPDSRKYPNWQLDKIYISSLNVEPASIWLAETRYLE